MHRRPPPLSLKYDNFKAPLVAAEPRKSKVKETFFQKLYKGNWANIVIAVAGLNAIRFAFSTYNALQDAAVDAFEHQPRLVTVSITLCVMYALPCLIEIFGVMSVISHRRALVRAYVFLEFGSALLVTVAGVLRAASFFMNAEDLMYECVALALTGQTFAKSQFRSRPWPSMYPLTLRQAQKQCVASWTQQSWTQVINVFLFGFVPALMCYMLVYTYYRQTTDSTHPAFIAPRIRLSGDRDQPSKSEVSQPERNGAGYTRVPNADDPYANAATNMRQRSARLRGNNNTRKSAAPLKPTATSTMTATAQFTTRGIKRAHRPPALAELEGPVFSPQHGIAGLLIKSASPLVSALFSTGPPSFGVNIVGPSRLGVGAYGPLGCTGESPRYSKFV